MTNHKDNPAEIYLVPMLGDDHDHIWSEDPAPGEGMREEDATRYVRADLVPESNAVLAERIAELTQLNSALKHEAIEQFKVIEHIAMAVGEEKDPYACHESVEALLAQVEQLRAAISPVRDLVDKLPEWEISYHKLLDDLENAMGATPAQCLAEIKAQAVEDAANHLGSLITAPAALYTGACGNLLKYANQIRKQASGTWLKDSNTHCNSVSPDKGE